MHFQGLLDLLTLQHQSMPSTPATGDIEYSLVSKIATDISEQFILLGM
jgi:hypothetical protein